ncbi:MAG: PHB depolymerase family esterase [Pseudomonadota bacterium]
MTTPKSKWLSEPLRAIRERPVKPTLATVLGFIILILLTNCEQQTNGVAEPGALPALRVDVAQTTVSGISSGAYMAGQFQMAHADLVIGAAIIAGGPYGCAESAFSGIVPGPGQVFLNSSRAVSGCMLNALSVWGVPNAEKLARRAKTRSQDGEIGRIADITSDQVYLFTGKRDQIVRPGIVRATNRFYQALGVPEDQIKLVDNLDAGHAFITLEKGLACSTGKTPFVEDCDYDQAGSLLQHLYGDLEPAADQPGGSFVTFDQAIYTQGLKTHGMAAEGVAYIPQSCRSDGGAGGQLDRKAGPGCRVHVAYHGCAQNIKAVGDAFVRDTGFARWADRNRLVVLYPQTKASALNPQGCWDWWGFTSQKYLTREAPQIIAVHRMLRALSGAQPASPPM